MIDKARLHQKSIQKIARGEVNMRKAQRRASQPAPQVTETTLHELIRRYLKMKGLKPSSGRVEIISAEEIIIHNRSLTKSKK